MREHKSFQSYLMASFTPLRRAAATLYQTAAPIRPLNPSRGFHLARKQWIVTVKSPTSLNRAQIARSSFSTSCRRPAYAQQATSADAYIQSGVVGKAENLVNVKKVLVIGSGGLSIGQAGEFDYSGQCGSQSWVAIRPRLTRNRIPSPQSAQGSQRKVRSHQSQYRHNSDRSQACR